MAHSAAEDPDWQVEEVEWDAAAIKADARSDSRSSPGASRRSGRGANTSCQVEGCRANLLPLRSYYQRQHICEPHFRALAITNGSGRALRFCQQCTKLEPLERFDGERRSCRDSLARRNERRAGRRRTAGRRPARKPAAKKAAAPAEAAEVEGVASGGSNFSGSVTGAGSPGHGSAAGSPAPGSAPQYKRQRTDADAAASPLAAYWVQPHEGTPGYSASGAGPLPAPLPGPAADQGAPAQLLLTGAALPQQAAPEGGAGLSGGLEGLSVDQLLAMDAEHLADLLLAGDTLPQPGAAPVGHAAASGDTSTSTESQTVADPDGWMLPHLELGVQAVLPLHPPQPLGRGQQAQQACVRPQLRPATAPLPGAQAALPPAPPLYFADPFGAPAAAGSLPGGLPGGAAAEPAGAAELEALLAELEPQLAAEEARVSLKLYGAHPDQLPPGLRAELLAALALPDTAVQAALRSGCVHLTITALASAGEAARLSASGAAAAAAVRLLPLARALPSGRLAVQVQGSSAALLAVPRDGRPALLLSLPAVEAELPPAVAPLQPLASTVSAAGGAFRLSCPRALLSGASGLQLHCRHGGVHVAVGLVPAGSAAREPPAAGEEEGALTDSGSGSDMEEDWAAAGAGAGDPLQPLAVDAAVSAAAGFQGWGLYEFEVARGALLSPATPLLLLPDSQVAAATELARLPATPRAAALLRLLATVLRFQQLRGEAAAGSPGAAEALGRQFPPPGAAHAAAAAAWLAQVARRAGWPAVEALVTPVASDAAALAAAATAPSAAVRTAAPAEAAASSSGSPRKQHEALSLGKPAAGGKGGAARGGGPLVPELAEGDSLRRAMRPLVLGAASLAVGGAVVGVGIAMCAGWLS